MVPGFLVPCTRIKREIDMLSLTPLDVQQTGDKFAKQNKGQK